MKKWLLLLLLDKNSQVIYRGRERERANEYQQVTKQENNVKVPRIMLLHRFQATETGRVKAVKYTVSWKFSFIFNSQADDDDAAIASHSQMMRVGCLSPAMIWLKRPNNGIPVHITY